MSGERRRDRRTAGARRPCRLYERHAGWVDHYELSLLGRFMTERGAVRPRGSTGNCARHQGEVAMAMKSARELALLPYAHRMTSERHEKRASAFGAVV